MLSIIYTYLTWHMANWPVHVLLSRVYPDFIQIKSGFQDKGMFLPILTTLQLTFSLYVHKFSYKRDFTVSALVIHTYIINDDFLPYIGLRYFGSKIFHHMGPRSWDILLVNNCSTAPWSLLQNWLVEFHKQNCPSMVLVSGRNWK